MWPTNRDRDAFTAAMNDDATVTGPLALTQIAEGSRVLYATPLQNGPWLGRPDVTRERITALTFALREYLKMVVIDLDEGDNSQVIFETLNHRGARLLAADLIKNLVFQVAESQGLDVEKLYEDHWSHLDTDYWRQRVGRGRQFIPRIDIFVNYWLMMRLVREVPSDRIFVEFRDHVMNAKPNVEHSSLSSPEMRVPFARLTRCHGRPPPGAFGIGSLRQWTLLLSRLCCCGSCNGPRSVSDGTSATRPCGDRELARSEGAMSFDEQGGSADGRGSPPRSSCCRPDKAGDTTESFLAEQSLDTRFWPTDDMVIGALREAPVYRMLLRSRLRMLLEAIEDSMRTGMAEGQSCPLNMTVEHVMPQAWRENWPSTHRTRWRRSSGIAAVHTLGNLTLVSEKLNPALSNHHGLRMARKGKRLSASRAQHPEAQRQARRQPRDRVDRRAPLTSGPRRCHRPPYPSGEDHHTSHGGHRSGPGREGRLACRRDTGRGRAT